VRPPSGQDDHQADARAGDGAFGRFEGFVVFDPQPLQVFQVEAVLEFLPHRFIGSPPEHDGPSSRYSAAGLPEERGIRLLPALGIGGPLGIGGRDFFIIALPVEVLVHRLHHARQWRRHVGRHDCGHPQERFADAGVGRG
jgi:hypothetical protein